MSEIRIGDHYVVMISSEADEDPREIRMIRDLAETITASLELMSAPAFVLRITETNKTKGEADMDFKIYKACGNSCILSMTTSAKILQTTSIQEYSAVNHDDSSQNYDGELKISVAMAEIWKDGKNVPNSKAEVVTIIAAGYYYQKILQYYPEWTTEYKDAPLGETEGIDCSQL